MNALRLSDEFSALTDVTRHLVSSTYDSWQQRYRLRPSRQRANPRGGKRMKQTSASVSVFAVHFTSDDTACASVVFLCDTDQLFDQLFPVRRERYQPT